jgi:hypothetical protein
LPLKQSPVRLNQQLAYRPSLPLSTFTSRTSLAEIRLAEL